MYTFLCKYNYIFKCHEVHYAIYDSHWYSLDPREAKDFIPFMIKVSEPIYFTAGKVFPITMVMFCSVITQIVI